jgi:hypothetical protein
MSVADVASDVVLRQQLDKGRREVRGVLRRYEFLPTPTIELEASFGARSVASLAGQSGMPQSRVGALISSRIAIHTPKVGQEKGY